MDSQKLSLHSIDILEKGNASENSPSLLTSILCLHSRLNEARLASFVLIREVNLFIIWNTDFLSFPHAPLLLTIFQMLNQKTNLPLFMANLKL